MDTIFTNETISCLRQDIVSLGTFKALLQFIAGVRQSCALMACTLIDRNGHSDNCVSSIVNVILLRSTFFEQGIVILGPMNASVILRQAVPEDLRLLQTLFVETINEVCRDDYNVEQRSVWTSAIKNEARWLEKIKNQYFLVALQNNDVVGYGSLENGDYLDFMYVHKDYQRQGIADKIYRSLEQEAKQLGTKILKSDVSKTARLFFESQGFHVIEAQTRTIDSVEISNFKMQKLL